MKFHFPVIVIDEDFRSENASGLGIRALAKAIEDEGIEVIGVTTYNDLSQFAQQQSRASAFILSIDDEEFTPGPEIDQAVLNLRAFIEEIRFRNSEIPIYLYGETQDVAAHSERHPARAARLHSHVRGHARIRGAPYHPRDAQLSRRPGAAVFPRADGLRAGRLLFVALPRTLGRRRLPEKPGRPDVSPVLRREHAARRRVQRGRRARAAARPFGAGRGIRAQRGAHIQLRPSLLRDERHVDIEQDGVALDGGAWRHRARRPQLPQVDPARDHDDGRDPGLPDADAQSFRHHRPDSARRVPLGEHRKENQGASVRARSEAPSRACSRLPRAPTTASSTTSTRSRKCSTARSTRCTSTKRGCRTRRFTTIYRGMHAIGRNRPRCKESMIFSTQSTHKLLAGLSQASQILVQDSETRKLDRHSFNEAYLMHTSTSPQYAIIASCDVAAAMMEPPGGNALVEESILEALDFRRAMRKIDERVRQGLVVQGVGSRASRGRGHRQSRRLDAARRTSAGTGSAISRPASTCSTRSRRP